MNLERTSKGTKKILLHTLIPILILCLLPTLAWAQAVYPQRSYQIDLSAEGERLPIYWNGTGFTPGNLLLRSDMQLTLDYQAAIPNQGMHYVRPHWLLNMVTVRNPGSDQARYDYQQLFSALDQLVNRGMKPIFEIMGFPRVIGSAAVTYDADAQGQRGRRQQWIPDFQERSDYLLWHDFIIDLTRNLEDRYGSEELKSWYFESTNEPDIHEWFWDQGIPALLNYWDATSSAIKAVNEDYRFGGPGTATVLSPEFKAVIAHCDTGSNAITGETGSVLDFISVHAKNRPYAMIDMEQRSIDWIREHHPRFRSLPFWNNEADPTWGWRRPFWWRPTAWYASFIIQSVDAHNRLLIDTSDINYGLLLNDKGFLGDWYTRTALSRWASADNPDHFWLIKKPVHNAMTLLAHMQGQRLPVEGLASERDYVSVLASRLDNGQVAILFASLPDLGPVRSGADSDHPITPLQLQDLSKQGAHISLSLSNLGIANPVLSELRIDRQHANPYGRWQDLGQPESGDADTYAALASDMEPAVLQHRQALASHTLAFPLPPAAVRMFIISPSDPTEARTPEPPVITAITPYRGLNGERSAFIRWQQHGTGIVAYHLWASHDGGAYKRITPQPVLDLGFLYMIPEDAEEIHYRVEVVAL